MKRIYNEREKQLTREQVEIEKMKERVRGSERGRELEIEKDKER